MKKKLIVILICDLISLVLSTRFLIAQNIPQGINYQAIARDVNGMPLVRKDLVVEISIIRNEDDMNVWQEIHYVSTDEIGAFSLVIGQGDPYGTSKFRYFSNIDWGSGSFHVNVKIDFGYGFIDMGSMQLQSVPYALMADSAAKAPKPIIFLNELKDVDVSDITKNETLLWNGKNWAPGKSIKASQLVVTDNFTVNGDIKSRGNAFIGDTLYADVINAKNAVFDDIAPVMDFEIDSNLIVGKSLKVKGDVEIGGSIIANDINNLCFKMAHDFNLLKRYTDSTVSMIQSDFDSLKYHVVSDSIFSMGFIKPQLDSLQMVDSIMQEKRVYDSMYFEIKMKDKSEEMIKIIEKEASERIKILDSIGLEIKNLQIEILKDSLFFKMLINNEITERVLLDSALFFKIIQDSLYFEHEMKITNGLVSIESTERKDEDNKLLLKIINLKTNLKNDSILFDNLIENENMTRKLEIKDLKVKIADDSTNLNSRIDTLRTSMIALVDQEVTSRINENLDLQQEINKMKTGAGLSLNGNYIPFIKSNYINGALETLV